MKFKPALKINILFYLGSMERKYCVSTFMIFLTHGGPSLYIYDVTILAGTKAFWI
jgi:hypothetical protein